MVAQLSGVLSDRIAADEEFVVEFVILADDLQLADRNAGIGAGRSDDAGRSYVREVNRREHFGDLAPAIDGLNLGNLLRIFLIEGRDTRAELLI